MTKERQVRSANANTESAVAARRPRSRRGRWAVLAGATCLLLGLGGCADDDETGEPGECYPFTGCTDSRTVDGGSSGGRCTNTCQDAYDGYCDDGGPGSDFSICTYGTDCSDCGVRY